MTDETSTLGVALVGCGTVGRAVATILTRDREILASRLGARLELRRVVDTDLTGARELGLEESLLTQDLADALEDPGVGVVVELVGGTTSAKDIIERSLRGGKHVVTANKALMAHFGAELFGLARASGVCIALEASCAGGVPILRALCGGLLANRIDALYGIVNGTCNHILTAMTQRGLSYARALAEAQQDGLAEAEPTLDVSGTDSAHKLAILASLAFGRRIDFGAIPVEGIDSLELRDISYGQELGYVVKLLAIAQRGEAGISLRVRPVFIAKDHPLSWVSGAFNAISVYGHATGPTMYYGQGAGMMPTGSAVVSDLMELARNIVNGTTRRVPPMGYCEAERMPVSIMPMKEIITQYYFRFTALDRPGVLSKISGVLGEHNISIASVIQKGRELKGGAVPVVMMTHEAKEEDVRKALEEIDKLDVVKDRTVFIRVEDRALRG